MGGGRGANPEKNVKKEELRYILLDPLATPLPASPAGMPPL